MKSAKKSLNGSQSLALSSADTDIKLRPKTDKKPATTSLSEMIAVHAYFLAEKRGFTPGNELDDWLRAEGYCYVAATD